MIFQRARLSQEFAFFNLLLLALRNRVSLVQDNLGLRVIVNIRLIEHDSRMTSASFEASWLDPFARSPAKDEAPVESQPIAAVAPVVPEVKPSDAGLTLSSVMISPRRKTATINGEVYYEHGIVSASLKDDGTSGLAFRIVRISSKWVELEREGKFFLLELSRPALAQGDEIERHSRRRGE